MGGIGLGLGLAFGRGPSGPATTSVTFGNLSRSGVGSGVPTTATSISSGDASGHWQVSAGVLCPSVAGDTANLNLGPYSLVMNNGDTFNVTIEANCWSVSTQAEWDFIIAQATGTLASKIIRVRRLPSNGVYTSGVNGTAARLRRADYTGLIIKGDDTFTVPNHEDDVSATSYPLFDTFILRGTRNVTFQRLDFDATISKKFDMIAETANHIAGITIDWCRLRGTIGDANGNYTAGAGVGANQYPNGEHISAASSPSGNPAWTENISLTNNHSTWSNRFCNIECGTGALSITGNRVKYFYEDAVRVNYPKGDIPTTITDNVISHPLGKGTDTGNLHCDAIQCTAVNTATTDWTVNIHRNRIWRGNARGELQGIFCTDFYASAIDSGFFFVPTVIGNVIALNSTQSLVIANAKTAVMLNNTAVAATIPGASLERFQVGAGTDSTTSGTHRLERNISEGYTIGGTPTLVNNQTLAETEVAYAAMFDGSVDWDVETLAELMATFSRKTGGPGDLGGGPPDAGAIGSAAVTWATTVPGSDGANLVS